MITFNFDVFIFLQSYVFLLKAITRQLLVLRIYDIDKFLIFVNF